MGDPGDADVIDWLLAGDPAVRWQVLAHLTAADAPAVAAERARVGREGWGARLLAEQAPDGSWGGGMYSPKWVSTTYTLLHLMWLGLPSGHPAALLGLGQLWDWQGRWRYWEACIQSMLVRLTVTFPHPAPRLDDVVADLLEQQQDDGGWNCRTRTDRAQHGSFHTSIQALEALQAYRSSGGSLPVQDAVERCRAFFLRHRLYQSHRTGDIAIPASTRFPAFPEWHFDVLRGLEAFAAGGVPPDGRLQDAVALVLGKRRKNGRWPTYAPYSGRQWFRLEPAGEGRITTVRALRVLRWWQEGYSSPLLA
jgi:hypothetical protein